MIHAPKISAIIPIYNADKYLICVLDCILNQSFSDWECLLIDDGSSDESGKICDEYAQKDNRFKVIHKPNGGVSSARNVGLDNARGEWITFIDADDFISNNYFNAIENSNEDMVFTKSRKFFPETNKYVDIFSNPLVKIVDTRDYWHVLSQNFPNQVFRTPWGKFIKRSIIGDTRFELGQKLGEDTLFNYSIYKDATSIQFDDHSEYYWRVSSCDDSVKYNLYVVTGVQYLSRIYEAYKRLGLYNPRIESFFLSYFFKLLDRNDLSINYQVWFSAPVIKEIEQFALPMWGTRKKIEYLLWRKPQIAKIYHSILNFLRRII